MSFVSVLTREVTYKSFYKDLFLFTGKETHFDRYKWQFLFT